MNDYEKEDVTHIEEVPQSKESGTSSDTPYVHASPVNTETRWGRCRAYFREPPIPAGEFITRYPNRWSRLREIIRQPAAEFIGTMLLCILGLGTNCQTVLGPNPGVAGAERGGWIAVVMGWAGAVAIGVWVSGGISGGHINPAITIALATFRDFPWRKVPAYVLAQVLGAFCGAAIVYGNYLGAINVVEGGGDIRTVPGTASLFGAYALDYVTNIRCFLDQFLGTAILMLTVCAVTDMNNGPPPPGMLPLVLFCVLIALGAALGMQTSYAINPARDFGPRVFTAMAGYGRAVFTYRNHYWIWCPILGPICGAMAGVFMYDLLLYLGSESILNKPDKRARRVHAHAMAAERTKPGISGPEFV